ncbi:MAG TPA: DUF1501 domain-containing protein [Solirubrobacteraceae bacterium]|jgi:uncharacterized protein (DUF1501 family)|nr:DUF1501 domain-containing protein [Solirubrobacteraceae bacterium]
MDSRIPTCCDGLSRSQMLARVGSPREWDPRMPVPAGAGIDRRRFLLGAAGGLVSVYGAGRLGLGGQAMSEGIAQAAETQGAGSPILVSIFLAGGIDALSVLAPTEDPTYRKLRPTLAVAPGSGTPFSEDPRLSWSAAAGGFAGLHEAGKLTVLPGIGYADPDMSHFTSRHYWEVGETSTTTTTGWMGRYLDQVGSSANPLQGLSMDAAMNPTLATAVNPVAAIDRPENFSLWMQGVWGDVFSLALDSTSQLGDAQRHSRDPAIAQVAAAAAESGIVRRALTPFVGKDGKASYTSPVAYPTAGAQSDFPQRLAGLAAMIAHGLPLRCVALSPETQFDTHASQASTLTAGVTMAGEAIAAFQADLEARGIADRVLVHVWSEFGRRALENGSHGTDHGAAGLSMLIGSRVTGTMIGQQPSLQRLDANGNPRENVDFRGIYCSLLEQWFGHDASGVIPHAHRFPRHTLLT